MLAQKFRHRFGNTLITRFSPIIPLINQRAPAGIRHASLEAGENKSGHIHAGPNEGIFFFDCMYRVQRLTVRD